MPTLRILAFVLLFGKCATAQPFEDYRPLQSQGVIPIDFTTPSSAKFEVAKESLDKSDNSTDEAKQNFLLESNFLIDQILGSGRVLFNDPVSEYLNDVLDTVLTNDPTLRERLRIYAVRSSIVNSFTTDDGIILVNIGLLAQLENEAQLAFILCHEIAHFTEHHIINAYVQNEEVINQGEFKRNSFDEKMLSKSGYSQSLEKEADRLGLARFSELNYSTASLTDVYEVMRYAHLPFDDIPFDKAFFNQENYRIDDSYFLNRVRPVESVENEGLGQATHPSPTERQQLMRRTLGSSQQTKGARYLVSEERFTYLRTVCRFELSNIYLKANKPVLSIYNSFLLLQSYPENRYLKKQIALSLYTLSKFKTGGNFGYVHPGFSHLEGESQQVFHLFYRLKPQELNVLATGYLWRLRSEFPDNTDLKAMSHDLLTDLMQKFYVPGMFARTQPPTGWDTPDTTASDNKYDRLKEKSKSNPRLTMTKYALVDLFEDYEFESLFDSLEQKYWGPNSTRHASDDASEKNKEELRYWKNHGFNLGIEKVVVVSPTYAKLDLRRKRQHRFLRSETARVKLTKQIKVSCKLLDLGVEILDQQRLGSSEVNQFNDIVFLNEWVDQRFTQLDVSMVNMPQGKIDSLVAKYGTEYFSWTGVINYRENKPFMLFYLLYALIPPAIPLAAYYLIRPNYDTYYYNITFNLKTGQPVLVNYNNYRKRDARDMINSSIYDSFWQMKREPKKK